MPATEPSSPSSSPSSIESNPNAHLLNHTKMARLTSLSPKPIPSPEIKSKTQPSTTTTEYHDLPSPAVGPSSNTTPHAPSFNSTPPPTTTTTIPQPRLYKRRFLGLTLLILLNIVVSWSWLTFAPVSATTAQYFAVSIPTVNWLSTGFLFAFVAATPAVLWTLNRWGPKGAIIVASALIVVGSWVRYAGTRANADGTEGRGNFGVVVFGQVLIGLAQPFVLAAPTRYSEMWFSETGRISATAAMSLANPFGGAIGQLVDPFWAGEPGQIPGMVLWVAVISTIPCLPCLLLPSAPPTPPTTTTSLPNHHHHPRLTLSTLRHLLHNPSFHLLAAPFAIYVTCFNATSSLLVPILTPHAFSETSSGISGAILIVVGLVAAAIASPILDRYPRLRLPLVKLAVPVIAACYLALVSVPGTGSVAGVYVLMGVLGAASFVLVPVALEMLVEVTWPEVGAEVSSCVCWAAGQLGSGIFIVVMDALGEGAKGQVARGLVWQAIWAVIVVPIPLCLGFWGTGVGKRRGLAEESEGSVVETHV